jgi:serine/threonine protein phosphatase 1
MGRVILVRTLVISDIHGCLEQFNRLLELVKYDSSEDTLVLLGDYVDRGPASKESVEAVMALVKDKGVIALKGNHDQRFVDILENNDTEIELRFMQHGGVQTLQSYCGAEQLTLEAKESIRKEYASHIAFLDSLPLYHEDEHHIYVHAGLSPDYPNWKEQPPRNFMWLRDPFVNHKTVVEKTVVFGHTRTVDIHGKADIWFGGDKIGIDGGCAYGFQMNALEITDGVTYKAHFAASDTTSAPSSTSGSISSAASAFTFEP